MHEKTAPYWAQANDCAENFMKNLSKIIQISNTTNSDYKEELQKFLRSYRSTPHTSTNVAPADLIFQASNQVRLPRRLESNHKTKLARAQESDEKSKRKMKEYGDSKRRACEAGLKIGDSVLLTRSLNVKVKNKGKSFYLPEPCTVIKVNKSIITATRPNGKIITRNAAVFKKNTAVGNRQEIDLDEAIAASSASESKELAEENAIEISSALITESEPINHMPEITCDTEIISKDVVSNEPTVERTSTHSVTETVLSQRPSRNPHPVSKYDARSGTWSKT